jgi:hypothetical protein
LAARDGSHRRLASESPRLLRLEKVPLNPGPDLPQLPTADAAQASGVASVVWLSPQLCARISAALKAPGLRSAAHPRNQRQSSKRGKQTERVLTGLFSFRLLRHIVVMCILADEDQPQRGYGQQQHHRTDQHAPDDHGGQRTLHLAADTG